MSINSYITFINNCAEEKLKTSGDQENNYFIQNAGGIFLCVTGILALLFLIIVLATNKRKK
jgi:hypothetical protein